MNILHKDTGAILVSSQKATMREAAEEGKATLQGAKLQGANLQGANLQGSDLRRATLQGAKLNDADLYGANLQGAKLNDADLQGADLQGATLQRADLQGATLQGAILSRATLYGANLQGANLQGVNLNETKLGNLRIIDGGLRSDGYRFLYTEIDGDGPHVVTGCYNFASFAEAREHWRTTRGGTPLGVETMLILDHLEKLVTLRWGEVES